MHKYARKKHPKQRYSKGFMQKTPVNNASLYKNFCINI